MSGLGMFAGIIALVMIGFALALLFGADRPAHATWKPEYATAPQAVQDRYRSAELTPAARSQLGWIRCCDHADVVRIQFKVDKSTGRDTWLWLDGETWRVVPADIIHDDVRAPGGRPVLFVCPCKPTCFFLPDPGI